MLTATYSLVTIAAEQENARGMLSRLRHYIQSTWKGFQGIDFGFLETAFNKMMQFDTYFRTRKLEVYVIPALRSAGREANAVIAELECLSNKGLNIIHSVRTQLSAAFDLSAVRVSEICEAMEQYCDHLFVRLDREDRELIPLARRLLSIEDWFNIAAQFLSDGDGDQARRQSRRGTPTFSFSNPRLNAD